MNIKNILKKLVEIFLGLKEVFMDNFFGFKIEEEEEEESNLKNGYCCNIFFNKLNSLSN